MPQNSYSGTESYRYVERLIRDGKDLSIISPYVSLRYAKMLSNHARRHRVRLITSRSPTNEDALSYLGKHAGTYRRWAKASLFLAVLAALGFLLDLYYVYPALAAVSTSLAIVSASKYGKGEARLSFRIAGGAFVHEKLYLSKGTAIVGSANLTFNGLHRNVEHIEVITEGNRLETLYRHFNELWRSSA